MRPTASPDLDVPIPLRAGGQYASMRVVVLPRKSGYRTPSALVLGLATPGIVVGSFVLGPAAPAVAAAVVVLLLLVLRIAPSLNDRLYGGPRSSNALLSAGATAGRVSGRCVVAAERLVFAPYRRGSHAATVEVELAEVEVVQLQAQGGPQPSVWVTLQRTTGGSEALRVFCSVEAVVRAVQPDGVEGA